MKGATYDSEMAHSRCENFDEEYRAYGVSAVVAMSVGALMFTLLAFYYLP